MNFEDKKGFPAVLEPDPLEESLCGHDRRKNAPLNVGSPIRWLFTSGDSRVLTFQLSIHSLRTFGTMKRRNVKIGVFSNSVDVVVFHFLVLTSMSTEL